MGASPNFTGKLQIHLGALREWWGRKGGEFMGGSKGPAPLKNRKIHIHRTKKKLFVFSNTMKALEIIACVLSFGHFFFF